MAKGDILVTASLDIPQSTNDIKKNDLPKLSAELQADSKARVKIIAGLDLKKSADLIQANLNTLVGKANAPSIKVGIDVGDINAKKINADISEQVSKVTSSVKINDQTVKDFISNFSIAGKESNKLNKEIKSLLTSFSDAFNTADVENYYSSLKKIFDLVASRTFETPKSILQQERKMLNNSLRIDAFGGENQVWIGEKVKEDLVYILDGAKQAKGLLDSLFGAGKWSYKQGKGRSPIDSIISQEALDKSGGVAQALVDIYNSMSKIDTLMSSQPTNLFDAQGIKSEQEALSYVELELQKLLNLGGDIKNTEYSLSSLDDTFSEITADMESSQAATQKFSDSLASVQKQAQKTVSAFGNSGDNFVSNNQIQSVFDDIDQAEAYFKNLNFGEVSKSFNKGTLQDIKDFTISVKSATGEYEKFKYVAKNVGDKENPIWAYELRNINASNEAVQRLNANRNKAISDLEQDLAQFKSTNSSALSGLTQELAEAESKLDGLREGTVSINEARASYNALNIELSKTKANLRDSFNPFDNADKNIKNGEDTIAGLTAEFKGLVDYPKEINEELATCASLLQKVKNIEAQEGRTANWSAAYKEWSDSVNSLTSKYKALKKEQTNIFSAQEKLSQDIEKENINLAKQQEQWKKQGILVGDFEVKVQQLANSLAAVGDVEGLKKYKSELQKIKLEAIQLNNIKIQDNKNSKLAQDIDILKNRIISFRNENRKAEKDFSTTFDGMLRDLDELKGKKFTDNSGIQQLQEINRQFRSTQAEIRATGKTGDTVLGGLIEKAKKFSSWMSLTFVISSFVGEVRNAVTELKEIDTILTEISKTSDRTAESLNKLEAGSFDKASKYGRTASDYLLGVQEMSRAGFGEAESESMAELSVLVQSAGDMTAELANEYLIATDAAYQLEGSADKLNNVLDSQNFITNHNALNMTDLANATKLAASQSAQANVGIDEMTAAVGTMIATTQQGGDVAGRAFRGKIIAPYYRKIVSA